MPKITDLSLQLPTQQQVCTTVSVKYVMLTLFFLGYREIYILEVPHFALISRIKMP